MGGHTATTPAEAQSPTAPATAREQVTLDIHAIASALYGSTLVSQLPLEDQPQGHHPIRLIHHQSVQHRHRHGHRPPIQHRRDGHRALRPVRQRGQAHRRRDRLVLVRNKSREMIVVVGEAGVGVPGEERELYGGGQERRRREVELVDGEAYQRELGLGGAVNQP
nr:hypothetical protein TorRG33x02_069590 [Ipomoea batatas]